MILHSNLTSDSEHLRPQLNTPMSVWLNDHELVSSCVTVTRPSPLQGSDKQGSIPILYTLYAVITSLITQDGGQGRWCRPHGTGSSPAGSSPCIHAVSQYTTPEILSISLGYGTLYIYCHDSPCVHPRKLGIGAPIPPGDHSNQSAVTILHRYQGAATVALAKK